MFRKMVCATFVMAVCIGLVAAEEFTASIKKVDGDKVTFTKVAFGKKDKDKKAEDTTLPVTSDATIAKGKYDFKEKKTEVGDKIEGGLKNEIFTKIGEKGVFARITTSDDNKTITRIVVTTPGKKKDKTD